MVLSFHPETARCVQSTAFSNQRMETAASIVREDENFANTAAEALRFGHNAHIQDSLDVRGFFYAAPATCATQFILKARLKIG